MPTDEILKESDSGRADALASIGDGLGPPPMGECVRTARDREGEGDRVGESERDRERERERDREGKRARASERSSFNGQRCQRALVHALACERVNQCVAQPLWRFAASVLMIQCEAHWHRPSGSHGSICLRTACSVVGQLVNRARHVPPTP